MSGTVVPSITADQFRQRQAAQFPNGWANQDARTPSGNLGALLLAWGQGLAAVLSQLQYALSACYLQSETSPELDLASVDYFGVGGLPRPAGMGDADYYQLILSTLFRTAVTRQAIEQALLSETGESPRMIEPWNVLDTGAADGVSYFDIDTPSNPARISGEETFTGFIESIPGQSGQPLGPGNSVYGTNGSIYFDTPGSLIADIRLSPNVDIYRLVNQLRAYGVVVGIKIVGGQAPTSALAPSDIALISPDGSILTTASGVILTPPSH